MADDKLWEVGTNELLREVLKAVQLGGTAFTVEILREFSKRLEGRPVKERMEIPKTLCVADQSELKVPRVVDWKEPDDYA